MGGVSSRRDPKRRLHSRGQSLECLPSCTVAPTKEERTQESQPSRTKMRIREREGRVETYPRQLNHQIGILDAHVLRVSTEDGEGSIGFSMNLFPKPEPRVSFVLFRRRRGRKKQTNLSSLSIVLVLARELLPFEPIENLGDGLGRFGEHGLERHTW